MSLVDLFSKLKGSSRSGNFGHSGRPGKEGGSGPGKGGSGSSTSEVDVERDADKDGITDAARVGVSAFDVPIPPPISQLPNLTPYERQVESDFIKAFEKDPDKMAQDFLKVVKAATKEGDPPTFGTDDAKVLASKWTDPPVGENRATLNTPLHGTANAIAKKAFLAHLDTLNKGDEVLVTAGGCGAGKGYALKNVPEALAAKQKVKAVWDSAGDQNATENPWLQKELEKRGLKGTYVYVHADPKVQWSDPNKGVVKRAGDPKDGRMVDGKVYADSYAIGARNHQAFYEANRERANFIFLDNTGTPKLIGGIPKDALNIKRQELAKFVSDETKKLDAPAHVKQGATIGDRIWDD